MSQPTRREVIKYIMDKYPNGNPFLACELLYQNVHSRYVIEDKGKFIKWMERLQKIFSKKKYRRELFWNHLEEYGSLGQPFQGEPKTKNWKSASNAAYNKEWEDLTNRSQMLLTDEIVEGIEKISREQNVCITTLIDYIGQRCRERRENYQTLPVTTQSVICDPLSNTNTNDNIKHEIKEEMDHEIKEEVIDDDPLCVDYGTKVEDDLDIKEHNIEI